MTESASFARWQISAIVCCAIAISYFDRQTLPVAIAAIQRDITMSNTGYSALQSAFLMAYALMYAAGGRDGQRPTNCSGATPMIVYDAASICTTVPMTFARPPKSVCHAA